MSQASRKAFLVTGIVQGVGYRYYAGEVARRMGVTGFVRNLPDGCVEVLGEGNDDVLASFLEALKLGPAGSSVERVLESEATSAEAFTTFTIRG